MYECKYAELAADFPSHGLIHSNFHHNIMAETTPLLDNDDTLGHAANDVYEAVVDDDNGDEDVVWLREQRKHNKTLHWTKRPSVVMVGACVWMLALAISLAEGSKQTVQYKLACLYLQRFSQKDYCDPKETQVVVLNLQLCYSVGNAIITIFATGKVGPLSDQYGRKPFLVLVMIAFFASRCLRYFIIHRWSYLRFNLMVAAEMLANTTGGVMSLVAITNCYISDVAEPHERIFSLGLAIASLFLGFSIGPLIGNWLLKTAGKWNPVPVASDLLGTDPTIHPNEFVPFKFEIGVMLFIVLFAAFVVPESRSNQARKKLRSLLRSLSSSSLRPTRIERLQRLLNFLAPLRLLTLPKDIVNPRNMHRRRADRFAVAVLVGAECILTSVGMCLQEINVLYGIYRFGWSATDIGHLLAIACSTKAMALLVLSPIVNHKILQKWCGFRTIKHQYDMIDFFMTLVALTLEGTGLMLMYLAPTTKVFFAAFLFTSFGAVASPSLSSSIVKFFPESKIGELFGAIALTKNFCTLVVPITLLSIYKKALASWGVPGLPFALCLVTFLVLAVSMVAVKWQLKLDRHSNPVILTRSNSVASLVPSPVQAARRFSGRQNSFEREVV